MQRNHQVQDQKLRDEVGPSELYPEAAQSESLVASYTILRFAGSDLPKDYHPMVFSKWLRSLRYGNDYFKLVHVEAYYRAYHRYISKIIEDRDCVVRLAVLSDDHDVALGFSVCRGNVLDYVHVHKHQRRMGIGTSLVPQNIDTISHVTKTGLSIWGSKYRDWKFNPFV